MMNLIIPALLLVANTLAQSPGTFTMNVTTHSTGAPGSGCIILAQIATLSAPNTITAMKPICPPTAPNPSTLGGEVIPWPVSADGDGAASDIAIYGNLPGGDGDTWKPGCVMMVTQRQVSYLLGRNLEWNSDAGQILDITGGGYLLDTENNYARMICQSNHPYMAGDLNLPSPNVYKPDNSIWWTALTVNGLGEGEWPSPPLPSSSAVTQDGGSETPSASSEGPTLTTSFRFIDTATALLTPAATSLSEVTGDSTPIQEPSLVISAQPTDLGTSASVVSGELPSTTSSILSGIESQQSELPTKASAITTAILTGVESQQSGLLQSSSQSSSISSTDGSVSSTSEAQVSPPSESAVSSIIGPTGATSDLSASSTSDVTVVSSVVETDIQQQISSPIMTEVPAGTPAIDSDTPTPATSSGIIVTTVNEEVTLISTQAPSVPINGEMTTEPASIISTASETPTIIAAISTSISATSIVLVSTSTPEVANVVPSTSSEITLLASTSALGQTEVAAPTLQVPNKIPISALSSLAPSSLSSSIISSITESSSAVESTASSVRDSVIGTTSSLMHTTTPDVESPTATAAVGEPKLTTLTPNQDGATPDGITAGTISPSSIGASSLGAGFTLSTAGKAKTVVSSSESTQLATESAVPASTMATPIDSITSIVQSTAVSPTEDVTTALPIVNNHLPDPTQATNNVQSLSMLENSSAPPISVLGSISLSSESSTAPSATIVPLVADSTIAVTVPTGVVSAPFPSALDTSISPLESSPILEPTMNAIANKGAAVKPKTSVLRITSTIYANPSHPTSSSVVVSPMCCSDVISVSERDLTTITVVSTATCIPCASSTVIAAQKSAQITTAIQTTATTSLEAGSALAHTDEIPDDQARPATLNAPVIEPPSQSSSSGGMSTSDPSVVAQIAAVEPLEAVSDASTTSSTLFPTSETANRANPTSQPAPSAPILEASPPPAPEASPPPAAEASPSPAPAASVPTTPETPPSTATLDVPTFDSAEPFRELGFFPFSASLRLKQRQRGRGGQGGPGGHWGGGGDHRGGWTGGQAGQPAPAEIAAVASTEPAVPSAAEVIPQYTQPVPASNYESMYDQNQPSAQDESVASNPYSSVWSSVLPKTGSVASETGASTIDRETVASATSTITSMRTVEMPSNTGSWEASTARITSATAGSSIGFSNAANGTDDSSGVENGELNETNGNDNGEDIGVNGDPTITIDDGSTGSKSLQATSLRTSQASSASRATSVIPPSGVSSSDPVKSSPSSSSARSKTSALSTQVMSPIEPTGETSLRPGSSSNPSSGMESPSIISSSSATSRSSSSSKVVTSSSSSMSQYTASPASMASTNLASGTASLSESDRSTAAPISSSTPSVVSTSERSTPSLSTRVITSQSIPPEAATTETTSTKTTSSQRDSTLQPSSSDLTEQSAVPPTTTPFISSNMPTIQQPPSPESAQSSLQPTTAPIVSSQPTPQPSSSCSEQSMVEPTTIPSTSFQEPPTEPLPVPSSEQPSAEPKTFQQQTTEQPSAQSTFASSSQQSAFEQPPPSSIEDTPSDSPTAAPTQESSSSPVFTDAGATIGQFLTSLLSNANNPPADDGSGGGDGDVTTIGQFTPSGDIPGLAQATQTLAVMRRRGELKKARSTPKPVAHHLRRSRLRQRIDRI